MNTNPFSVGLDIGTTKVVCVIGRRDKYGKVEILAKGECESTGMERGMVTNFRKVVESIRTAVQITEQSAQVKITEVLPGIAGHHIHSRYGETALGVNSNSQSSSRLEQRNTGGIDLVSEDDLEELKQMVNNLYSQGDKEVIAAIPQYFLLDQSPHQVQDPVGMQAGVIKGVYHVVLGEVKTIRAVYTCVNDINLKVASITLEPIASAEAVLTADEKEMGAAIIDLGGGTTDLAIFYNGIITHTSVIPIGGNAITSDISKGLGITMPQAELLKTKYGSAWVGENSKSDFIHTTGLRGEQGKRLSKRTLSEIIYHRIDETLMMTIEQIKKHLKNTGVTLNAGIVLTGGGANLKDLKQLVEYRTGMPVRIGLPSENISSKLDTNLNDPRFSTAVGLLMEHIRINEANNISMTVPEPPVQPKKESSEDHSLETPDIKSETELEVQNKEQKKVSLFTKFAKYIEDAFYKMVDPDYEGKNKNDS